MPWRATDAPYRIWLSEIILQQTQVKQGWAYYEKFCEWFPDVHALAAASTDDLMKAWEGLGYYSRAKNLHKAAKTIVSDYNGQLPDTVDELLKLPGVGPYTARAIGAFAFGRQVAVVDGNVYRVVSRFLGDDTPIDTNAGKKHFQHLADELLGAADASAYNHAIMDFGATLCTPKRPNCAHCPLQSTCKAYADGRVFDFPVKSKKRKRGVKFYQFFWVETPQGVLLRRRGDQGLWKNLWELPNVEVDQGAQLPPDAKRIGGIKHEFTHFRMHIQFVQCDIKTLPEALNAADYARVAASDLQDYALPRAVQKLLALLDDPQTNLF